MSRIRCIVKDCANHADEGKFVGELCSPCHEFIVSGRGKYSAAYRLAERTTRKPMTTDLDILEGAKHYELAQTSPQKMLSLMLKDDVLVGDFRQALIGIYREVEKIVEKK
jgi:hypothetical protein